MGCSSTMHHRLVHVRKAWGASRSEVKEEPKAGDMSGGKYPVPCARTPNTVFQTPVEWAARWLLEH